MKKFFTLIAAALMTLGANAQGTYAVGEGTPADNEVVTSVPNITMTYGTGFKESSAQNALAALGFSYCTNGNDNPKLTDGVPTSGVFYKFEPAKNGTITTGIVLNADKPFFVTNSAADAEFTITKSDGTAVTLTDRKSSEKLTGGIVKFDVVANNTYYVYCTGSKLGFYGFIYEAAEGGDTPAPTGNVAGIYRPLDLTNLEVGDCSVAEAFGVKVTPIRGTATTYREEAKEDNSMDASDLYLGYSVKDAPKDNKAASAVYAADEVIFPFVAEQSARQENEFFGFTMEIPAGKSVNIDELDAYLLAGNAYQWQVEITDGAGNVVYKTQDKGIKINNYNKTAYTNGVHVTTTEVTEPTWSQEILESWSLAPNYDVTDTEVLPELKNLTGTYTVKVYYWGKWQKNLTYANVSLVLSQGTTGISSAIIENTAKSNVMYNLAGQRISAPVSGQIYILNGKKYIAK